MDPASPDDPFEGVPDDPPTMTIVFQPPRVERASFTIAPADPVAEAAHRVLSEDFRRRLQRTESEVAMSTAAEREGLCDWLGSMLHRPPLERPGAAYRPMRALVEALWWDLSDRTPADASDPDAGNPRLADNHPWGEGPDA